MSEYKLMRRVAGSHDIRLDGISDLLMRARGASVLDIGCNRGLVGFEFAKNGASLVHGCDNFERGIETARELFIDLRAVESRFEVVDLTGGVSAFRTAFGVQQYDIALCLATLHKLKRIMPHKELADLVIHWGGRTLRHFGWRATSDKEAENTEEMHQLDDWLRLAGLQRVHTSRLSEQLGLAAIWRREQ